MSEQRGCNVGRRISKHYIVDTALIIHHVRIDAVVDVRKTLATC